METVKIAKWFIISIIAIVIIFFVFLGGYYAGTKSDGQDYFKGWQDAKKQIEKAGIFSENNQPIFSLSGKITSVIGNTITLETGPLTINPLEKQTPAERTIKISTSTSMVYQRQKTAQEYNDEQTEYFKKIQADPKNPPQEMPTPYAQEKITVSDLKINDTISITSATNIRYENNINAEKIVKMDLK